MAVDEPVVIGEENPDDAAVEKIGIWFTPPFGPWFCNTQYGGEPSSFLFSIALSCSPEKILKFTQKSNCGYTMLDFILNKNPSNVSTEHNIACQIELKSTRWEIAQV